MSDGNEFQRSDAATENVRRQTVFSRNGGTNSWFDDADRSRRRLCRSATRASWFRYGGTRPCSTRNAMTATLKSTRCGRRSKYRVARASVTGRNWEVVAPHHLRLVGIDLEATRQDTICILHVYYTGLFSLSFLSKYVQSSGSEFALSQRCTGVFVISPPCIT